MVFLLSKARCRLQPIMGEYLCNCRLFYHLSKTHTHTYIPSQSSKHIGNVCALNHWGMRSKSQEPTIYSKKQIKIAKSFKLIAEKDASMNIVRETKTEQGSKEIPYINCMNLIILKSKFPKSIHNFCYCKITNFSNAS